MFRLIQRGSFRDLEKEYNTLTGNDGLIDLDYMGYAEFEWDAIPNAYKRIMGEYDKYDYHQCDDIKDYKRNPLILFCKSEFLDAIKKELKKYIEKPYPLKSYSTIRYHINGSEDEYNLKKNFFWCIDMTNTGNWMGWFGTEKTPIFKNAIESDYHEWWMKKPEDVREKEYNNSFDW